MSATPEIVGVGLSMVDIQAVVTESEIQSLEDQFGIIRGGRTVVDNFSEIGEVLRRLPVGQDGKGSKVAMHAGSTTLNSLNAMRVGYGQEGLAIITSRPSLACEEDQLFSLFNREVLSRGIDHRHRTVSGHNPASIMFHSDDDPEKLAIAYIGAGRDLPEFGLDPRKTELLLVDAYELGGGKITDYIDKLIDSGEYKVALGLGNHDILTGQLVDKIRNYISAGKITFLGGNEKEYGALLGDQPIMVDERSAHPFVAANVPYALMTFGEAGMVGIYEAGGVVVQPATMQEQSADLTNTSGAGDVSFGVFVAGIIRGDKPALSLGKASQLAGRVVCLPHGLV